MATLHRRIAVPRDPDLDAALRRAEPLLSLDERRSEARTLRTLALAGADALAARPASGSRELDERLHGLSARLPSRDWSNLPAPTDLDDLAAGTDTLAWVRGSR